jgi:GNAT superfamily N-acetyltransferase
MPHRAVSVAQRIISFSGAAARERRQAVLEGLLEFNSANAAPANADALCIALVDEDGATAGGLYGTLAYNWLTIELLFVPDGARGSGLGARLVRQAEDAARARGCIGAWLDTFSFQARGFYEKIGYALAGTIPDHPVGGARYFLMKRWG